jgi:hypothetical protein
MPLSKVLLEMEANGVLIDAALLRQSARSGPSHPCELQQRAHELAGRPSTSIRPSSCSRSCSRRCSCRCKRKTPTGQPSTARTCSRNWPTTRTAAADPRISRPREAEVTYTDKLPEQINPTHRPRAHQRTTRPCRHRAAVVDGPEPAEHPDPHAGRAAHPQAFIAPPGCVLMAATTRRSSCASWRTCPATRACCARSREDRDVPSATAAEVFGKKPDQVTPDQRRSAKAINFGLIYGMSRSVWRAARHRPRRGAAVRRPLLRRAIPACSATWTARASRRASGLRRNRVRAAACTCPRSARAIAQRAVRRAQRDQRADAGHRGRHHQACDAPRAVDATPPVVRFDPPSIGPWEAGLSPSPLPIPSPAGSP